VQGYFWIPKKLTENAINAGATLIAAANRRRSSDLLLCKSKVKPLWGPGISEQESGVGREENRDGAGSPDTPGGMWYFKTKNLADSALQVLLSKALILCITF
jgi:hypothetical protein